MGALLLDDVMSFLGLDDWLSDADDTTLLWPPDVFAAAAYLLRESGSYTECQKPCPNGNVRLESKPGDWQKRIRDAGSEWRNGIGEDPVHVPPRVKDMWGACKRHHDHPVARIAEIDELWQALVELCCTADEACRGVGLPTNLFKALEKIANKPPEQREAALERSFQFRAVQQLLAQAAAYDKSTLCRRIDSSRAVVLPKMRTPQRGITIRSISHHVTLVGGSDMKAHWFVASAAKGAPPADAPPQRDIKPPRNVYNLLVVPWPFHISPSQFVPLQRHETLLRRQPPHFDFFSFQPKRLPDNFDLKLQALIRNARAHVGTVHGLVLPEMAMTTEQFESAFGDEVPEDTQFLVCGLYEPPTAARLAQNCVKILRRSPQGESYYAFTQGKHHRWALDEPQVRTYGLGCSLDPMKVWWEAIDLPGRSLGFFALDDMCVFSVLICEDLARPDPVGDLLRAVGPNVVICLLADGPQLGGRWAARHATTLTDDPGSSVLTVTSLGMSQLSRPASADGEPSRVIALWRDSVGGAREIKLPHNAQGLVLSLTETTQEEFTCDGRGDGGGAGCVRLGGVHAISWSE